MDSRRASLIWVLFGVVSAEALYCIPRLNWELAVGKSGVLGNVFALVGCGVAVFLAWRCGQLIRHWCARFAARLEDLSGRAWILACVAVGIVVRGAWAYWYPIPLQSDYATYFALAKGLLEQHRYGSAGSGLAFWPPGYPFFLAASFWALGIHSSVPLVANLILFVLTILVVYKFAGYLLDEGSSRLATLLIVFWPTYFISSALPSKELLVLLLLPASLLAYYISRGRSRIPDVAVWALLSGFLLGFASLTQPSVMLFPAVFVVYEWLRHENPLRGGLRLACAIVAMIIVVFPWTLRNRNVLGAWVPISTNGGDIFYRANNPLATGGYTARGETDLEPLDELTRGKVGFALGEAWVRQNPGGFLALAFRKQMLFLGDDAQGVYETFKRGNATGGARYAMWKGLSNLYWWLLWFLILTGLFGLRMEGLRRAPELAGVMLSVMYLYAVHSVFESGSKYHLPLTAFIAILSALPAFVGRRGTLLDAGPQAIRLTDESPDDPKTALPMLPVPNSGANN